MIHNLRRKLNELSSEQLNTTKKISEISDECLILDKKYGFDYSMDRYSLKDFVDYGCDTLIRMTVEQYPDYKLHYDDFIFLDTETTGLSGGSGNVAFLTGIGYFKNGCFEIEQMFMRDYNEELSMLKHLLDMLNKFKIIVTFNGKSFDIPLLRSRFIMNRLRMPEDDIINVDLLYPSRRVWKKRIGSCSLESIESEIFNIKRTNDIPGSLIPGIYFEYLRTKNFRLIDDILRHNRSDILTLVFLATCLNNCLVQPDRYCINEDFYGIGKMYYNHGKTSIAEKCFDKMAENCKAYEALIMLSTIYKRQNEWEKAKNVWNKMIKLETGEIYPYIEFAKYYEHIEKEFYKALDYTEMALEISSKVYDTESLNKREKRLKKKVNKGGNKVVFNR